MFDRDKANENSGGARNTWEGDMRHLKKKKPSMPENLVDWADRIIRNVRSGDRISGRKIKISPVVFITILTLTMLSALIVLFCIYK